MVGAGRSLIFGVALPYFQKSGSIEQKIAYQKTLVDQICQAVALYKKEYSDLLASTQITLEKSQEILAEESFNNTLRVQRNNTAEHALTLEKIQKLETQIEELSASLDSELITTFNSRKELETKTVDDLLILEKIIKNMSKLQKLQSKADCLEAEIDLREIIIENRQEEALTESLAAYETLYNQDALKTSFLLKEKINKYLELIESKTLENSNLEKKEVEIIELIKKTTLKADSWKNLLSPSGEWKSELKKQILALEINLKEIQTAIAVRKHENDISQLKIAAITYLQKKHGLKTTYLEELSHAATYEDIQKTEETYTLSLAIEDYKNLSIDDLLLAKKSLLRNNACLDKEIRTLKKEIDIHKTWLHKNKRALKTSQDNLAKIIELKNNNREKLAEIKRIEESAELTPIRATIKEAHILLAEYNNKLESVSLRKQNETYFVAFFKRVFSVVCKEFTFEDKSLTTVKNLSDPASSELNKEEIVQHGAVLFAEHIEAWGDMYSSEHDTLTRQVHTTINAQLVENSRNIYNTKLVLKELTAQIQATENQEVKTALLQAYHAADIDYRYLYDQREQLFTKQCFNEFVLEKNNLIKNKDIAASDKFIRAVFFAFDIAQGLNNLQKAQNQKWDNHLQNSQRQQAHDFLSFSHNKKSEALIAFEDRLVKSIAVKRERVLQAASRDIAVAWRSYVPQEEIPYILTTTHDHHNHVVAEVEFRSDGFCAAAAAASMPIEISAAEPVIQERKLDTYVLHELWKNSEQTYLDHCVKQSQVGKQPLSQSEYSYHQVMTRLVLANMHEFSKTEACADLLKGVSQEAQVEIINTAQGIVIGGIMGVAVYGGGLVIGAVSPPAVPAYYLSLAVAGMYQNSGAVYNNGKQFVQAVKTNDFEAAGRYGTRTILDTINLVNSTKTVGLQGSRLCSSLRNHFTRGIMPAPKNLLGKTRKIRPQLAEPFELEHLEIAGVPQANFAVSVKAQGNGSNRSSNRSNGSSQPRNANKSSVAQTAEVARQQKIKARYGDKVPAFVREDRVPNDSETILASKNFVRAKYKGEGKIKGALLYLKDGCYYYRDTLHKDLAAELEVFNNNGDHLGTADVITGILKPNTAVAGRRIDN